MSSDAPTRSAPSRTRSARRTRHRAVAAALSALSDAQVAQTLEAATPLGTGIGGSTWQLSVAGEPVFAKRVALTEIELLTKNWAGTANLFDLPLWYFHGIGSAGAGAWRELAAHQLTSDLVLEGSADCFPLLYHWRVLPIGGPDSAEGPGVAKSPDTAGKERAERVDAQVAFWHEHPAVRARLEAIEDAPAGMILFLEHVPQNVYGWLTQQQQVGPEAVTAAAQLLQRELTTTAEVLRQNDLLHLDTHFGNVLTDGQRVYISDFGLASSPRFTVSEEEAHFLQDHRHYDRSYLVTELVNALLSLRAGTEQFVPVHPSEHQARIRAIGDGQSLPPPLATTLRRYAPIAMALNDYHGQLLDDDRRLPVPAEQLQRLCFSAGLDGNAAPDTVPASA